MVKGVDYYQVLGVPPSARERDIRQAYRQRCREYHPDTTTLPTPIALEKFLVLNEAYAILSHPMKRVRYDQQMANRRAMLRQPTAKSGPPRMQTMEIQERALSSTELFALFILGFTFLACLLLVVFVSWTRT